VEDLLVPANAVFHPLRSRAARLTVAALTVVVAAAVALPAVPAAANPPGPHDPIGHVDSVSAAVNRLGAPVAGQVVLRGWAADPDAVGTPVTVLGVVDGVRVASTVTSVARPDVARIMHTGPTTGFTFTAPVPTTGLHTLCAVVPNIGLGQVRVLSCVATPLGTVFSRAQLAARSPAGKVETGGRTSTTSIRVTGWASDPDYRAGPVTVVVYVDGVSKATLNTSIPRPDLVSVYGTGPSAGFSATVAVPIGAHLACVWAVNVGLGSNVLLGCRAIDTRGGPGVGAVSVPAVNRAVVAEANRHLGQPYVWGAAGPSAFDCSGLVLYSYRLAGLTTPRIAADQFSAARLIPAARAVPGDLVFYHDSVGSVYHVGIYIGNGMTDAAVDPANGVRHQAVYDPTATYGSFTHT
jgi:cell wall-associated NlpC family hydrolase